MSRHLTELRMKAQAHQDEIDRQAWFTPQQLAARWAVSVSTVKAIPFDLLPYKQHGRGIKHRRRRYAPEAVAAYESDAKPQARRSSAA